MLKLLFKKSFYDGWDNLLVLFINNIVFSALIIALFYSGSILLDLVLVLVLCVHLAGVNGSAFSFTRSKGSWTRGYVNGLKKAGHIILFTIIFEMIYVCALYIIPSYIVSGDFFWYTLGVCLAIICFVMLVSLAYFYPLAMALPNDKAMKTLHKCFLILSDNLGVSLYCLLKNFCELFISLFTAFLVPGLVGVSINQTNTIQLLMLKYDWMEEKKVGKHNVIADQYLAPVIEIYKDRSLKTLFVPWKNS